MVTIYGRLIFSKQIIRGSTVRYNNKNEKIKWKKPVVKTYGDAVEIIKVQKFLNLSDGYTFGIDDDPIGS